MFQVSHHGFLLITHSEAIQKFTQSHFITTKGVPITKGIKGFRSCVRNQCERPTVRISDAPEALNSSQSSGNYKGFRNSAWNGGQRPVCLFSIVSHVSIPHTSGLCEFQ